MPGLDRSGPMGAGPMTGGRRGLCGNAGYDYDMPVSGGLGYGRGLGLRRGPRGGFGPDRGGGRGFGRRFVGNPRSSGNAYQVSQTDEIGTLKAQANAMQDSLAAILKRITELEDDNKN